MGDTPHSIELRPSYAGAFRCIGPGCEDSCCAGWDIPVDKLTYLQYKRFPAEKLGSLVARFVSQNGRAAPDNTFAVIRQKPDGACPFFAEDRLCRIQKDYGAHLLSATCSQYPRALTWVQGQLEGALSLSCPEAARKVLLEENWMAQQASLAAGEFRTDNALQVQEQSGFEAKVLDVRALVVDLIRDRSRPLWQNILLIVSLCIRLDREGVFDADRVEGLLGGFRAALAKGPASDLEAMQPSIAARLEMAITLGKRHCEDSSCGRRFREVFWDFIEGIGSAGPAKEDGEASAAEDVERFRQASAKYLLPLLEARPFILENLVVNYVYQHSLPFGRSGNDRLVKRSMGEQAVLMAVQFAWLSTLLVGVAARYAEEFGEAEIVRTVQAFTRETEHAQLALDDALAFVAERQLDTLSGLAQLLRF